MNPIDIIFSSCPLILCSLGALFSEYAGILALFLEGMISFSAFTCFLFTCFTKNIVLGIIFSVMTSIFLILFFSFLIEKTKANYFIAGTAVNLLFSSAVSCFSFIFFKTRGVLQSPDFSFNIQNVKIFTISISLFLIILGLLFLFKTQQGLYIRISGSDSDVLLAKGGNPLSCRIISWGIAAFYAAISGCFLVLRISSFVPNISSGRGWMALAAVYLGQKKSLRIIFSVIIFCAADVFSANIQNYTQAVPKSVLQALPYIICILLILFDKPSDK